MINPLAAELYDYITQCIHPLSIPQMIKRAINISHGTEIQKSDNCC